MTDYILAIDQGTTSSRALIFDAAGNQVSVGQQQFHQHYPANGWVEHDADEIWETTLASCRAALKSAGIDAGQLVCAGITNQRETTVLWDRATGEPVHRAIVWQDRRTAAYCEELKQQELEEWVQDKTGLLLDPYFSATKLKWMLDNVDGAREKARAGRLAFGTVDSYLLWRLTEGRSHCTDATNASRTLLFNIHTQEWDQDLLELFDIPPGVLPQVRDCAADYGRIAPGLLGAEVPITGIIGDQQAAAFGQCCFSAGRAKSTYGTGCFVVMNTGTEVVRSRNRLLSTVAYRLDGETRYAVEGSIFMAGATMQWLRDEMHLFEHVSETEVMARKADDNLAVYLVPAFTGLGAPYWDPTARAAIFGMTRDTGANEIVAAGLLSVCYQTRDLVDAIAADGTRLNTLRVDGGMVSNDFLMQKLADILACEVHRPVVTETTALGAAYVAGLRAGVFDSLEEIESKWRLDREWSPQESEEWRETRYNGWTDAVQRTRSPQSST
ncbi:MAG: glycerol kinase GlpK [Pseudohongiellaceae bacterium]